MGMYHSYCAQLLASLLQHPLIFVFPGSVAWLNLSSKQQVVLCILMTWWKVGGHKIKNQAHTYIKTLCILHSIEVPVQHFIKVCKKKNK